MKKYKLELTEEEIENLTWLELLQNDIINENLPNVPKEVKDTHKKILSKIDEVYPIKKIKELMKKNDIETKKRCRADAIKEVKKYDEEIKKRKEK